MFYAAWINIRVILINCKVIAIKLLRLSLFWEERSLDLLLNGFVCINTSARRRRGYRSIDQLQRLKLPTIHDRADTIDNERALTTIAQRSRRVHGRAVSVKVYLDGTIFNTILNTVTSFCYQSHM